jgi:hypothetical protein
VDDLAVVEVDEGVDDLREVVLHFNFGEAFAAFDEFVEGLVGAHLEQDVDVLVILEDMFELDHVLVAQRLVDFDLSDQLSGQ